MEKKSVNFENIFIRYFYALLKEGDTCGVSEEEFWNLINNIKVYVEKQGKYTIDVKLESFESIINKVNHILFKNQQGFVIKNVNDKLVVKPIYNLRKLNRIWDFETGLWSIHDNFITEAAKQRVMDKAICFGIDDLQYYPREIINISKKVAAVYVNDIIERYVESAVKAGCWPNQCKDIDKFIFERDIAKCIDEKGTAAIFKQLYLHVIVATCEILKSSKDEDEIKFSNSEGDMFAFANFKKLFLPKEFEFLHSFKHNKYELGNKRIMLTIIAECVSFASSYCAFSDPYGEWSDEFVYHKGIVNNSDVLIMEKKDR